MVQSGCRIIGVARPNWCPVAGASHRERPARKVVLVDDRLADNAVARTRRLPDLRNLASVVVGELLVRVRPVIFAAVDGGDATGVAAGPPVEGLNGADRRICDRSELADLLAHLVAVKNPTERSFHFLPIHDCFTNGRVFKTRISPNYLVQRVLSYRGCCAEDRENNIAIETSRSNLGFKLEE